MFEFVNTHLEHFQATLLIMLYKTVLTFKFVPQLKILKHVVACDR